ncbi:MAG: SET domain-containing protein [Chitinophagaceae bacterium]|nr:MAG: SET domain-containing protein [Chitinophagaceae bacterium]
MAISPKYLVVKTSTIPGSGKGLFTKKFIPAGTRIAEYTGKVSAWKDAEHEDGDNGYIYYVKRNHVIDAKADKKSIARYANDARGLTRVKGIINNCEYVEEGTRVYIHAKKDIEAGSEILVPYGPEYWQVIRARLPTSGKSIVQKRREKPAAVSY